MIVSCTAKRATTLTLLRLPIYSLLFIFSIRKDFTLPFLICFKYQNLSFVFRHRLVMLQQKAIYFRIIHFYSHVALIHFFYIISRSYPVSDGRSAVTQRLLINTTVSEFNLHLGSISTLGFLGPSEQKEGTKGRQRKPSAYSVTDRIKKYKAHQS